MNPIDRIAVEYARRGEDFAAALERNYADGFVFATPGFFVMGREREGAWFIEAFSGDMRRVWDILPYELPNVTWYRFDKELHSIPLSVLKRYTHEMAKTG